MFQFGERNIYYYVVWSRVTGRALSPNFGHKPLAEEWIQENKHKYSGELIIAHANSVNEEHVVFPKWTWYLEEDRNKYIELFTSSDRHWYDFGYAFNEVTGEEVKPCYGFKRIANWVKEFGDSNWTLVFAPGYDY